MQPHELHSIKSSEVLIVDSNALSDMPRAFISYVMCYFDRVTFGDKEHFIAFRSSNPLKPAIGFDHENVVFGIAPHHCTVINQFKADLPEGVNLSEWIEQNAGVIPGFFRYTAEWQEAKG